MTTLVKKAQSTPLDTRTSSFQKAMNYLSRAWPLYVMLLPGLALLIIFNYYPMYGVRIAFQDYNPALGFDQSPWVGLKHFEYLLRVPTFKFLFRNTIMLAVGKIVFLQLAAIALAILVNEVRIRLLKRFLNQVFYLPHFLSWVIMGGILLDMLSSNGLVGMLLSRFGVNSFLFLGNATFFPWVIIISHVWKEVGWSTIIYLAAMTGIDPQIYEAAAVDGADRLRRIWHVTLPGIAPTIALIACLSLGGILDAGFDQIFNLYNPTVYATGDILDTYVYRAGLISARFSLATAVGLIKSSLGFIMISLAYWLAAKYANYRVF